MVAFTLTEDQQRLVETIHRYTVNDVRPAAHEADEDGRLPQGIIQKGWELGLIPAVIPEALGGFGDSLSALTGALAAEELAFGDLSLALALMSPALLAYPLLLYGTPEQHEHYLPLFLEDSPPALTAALLEPGILFDPCELATRATVEGDVVCIAGTKACVPLAEDFADGSGLCPGQ